jgi:hypothetical protein
MPDVGQDRSLSDAIATQTVGDEPPRLVLQPTQQVLEEALGSGAIPPVLHENVQHDAVLVHRTPQTMQRAADADEHFVEMPGVSWLRPSPAKPSGEVGTNFRHQCRMLSCVTKMPCSARISSTSRRLRLKTWYNHTEWLMISAGNRWRG